MIKSILQFIILFISLIIIFSIGLGIGWVIHLFIAIDPVWIGLLAILASLVEIKQN